MKKRIVSVLMVAAMVLGMTACGEGDASTPTMAEDYTVTRSKTERTDVADGEVGLAVSAYTNPVVGYSGDDDYTYGGDPSVLVDGDTVYLYTGHDTATGDAYVIPEYLCYSTTDLLNWTYEGVVMTMASDEVSWASGTTSAWAAQVAKHYDSETKTDKYYLYYCTWDATDDGRQSIGVAVSDSPTGTFVDIGEPLVSGSTTTNETSTWNDIDPTVWIETDEEGEEHRYLAWGNGLFYICELNEDMISVRDLNGDGEITSGSSTDEADIINMQSSLVSYTEAPWLYRRQDEEGNYYGSYYLFYAWGWRERLAYATTDSLLDGKWTYSGGATMYATTTSNTNHPAVFDFKGHTYMIYHDGSLPGGSGYRRSACLAEIFFDEDGAVSYVTETAAGIGGIASYISLATGEAIGHAYFVNSASDDAYPYTTVECGLYSDPDPEEEFDFEEQDLQWVLCCGKADTENDAYVSIQSENKPGLYITANEDLSVTLAQETDISDELEQQQTFHTVTGLDDADGVSFESVAYPGYYLAIVDNVLTLTDGSENATFYVTDVEYETE